tara:strand:- start:46 stop:273 length:228 start_codon:yes stop_codon:yes gene_type:complete
MAASVSPTHYTRQFAAAILGGSGAVGNEVFQHLVALKVRIASALNLFDVLIGSDVQTIISILNAELQSYRYGKSA